MRFKGKTVLVTGAGRNIGTAIARAFGAEGAAVAVTDIVGSQAEEVAGKMRSEGGKARAWALDVGESSAVAEVVAQVRDSLGPLHVLVNNAALVPRAGGENPSVMDMPEDLWDRVFRVNVKGAFLMSREVSRHMVRDVIKGKIVNIGSASAESARSGAAHYCCSKAALAMLTRVMALELGPHGIAVNTVSPGIIEVSQGGPMTAARKAYRDAFLTAIPLQRFGRPEEVARAVLFLAEEGGEYITGESLRVDGGTLAGRAHLPKGS